MHKRILTAAASAALAAGACTLAIAQTPPVSMPGTTTPGM